MRIQGDKWNLLDYAKSIKNEEMQRITAYPAWKDTDKPVTLSISEEGLRALHGQKLKGAVDVEELKRMEEILPKLSYNPADEHLWDMRNGITNDLNTIKEQKGSYTMDEMLSVRMGAYADAYEALERAYADGTRDVWVSDGIDENGNLKYHQVTTEEDFAYLDTGFERMKREIVGIFAGRENLRNIKEIFYGERIEIEVPEDYEERLSHILDKTIAEYKALKENGKDANMSQLVRQFFYQDKKFAEVMQQLYDVK